MNSLYTKKDGIASFYFAFALYMVAQLVIGMALLSVPADSVAYNVIYALLPISTFAIAWWYAKVSQKDFVKATTANVKPPIAHTLWGCLATFGLIHMMLPINELFLDWFENMGLNRPATELDLNPVMLVIMTVILAPIGEEFLFRGTIGRGLANDKPIFGILLSGGLFALFHLNPAQTLHQFVLGSFLMLLAYRSGSVWTSVITHAFNNFVLIFFTFVYDPTEFYTKHLALVGIVGGLIFCGGVVGFLLTTKCHAKQNDTKQNPSAINWTWFAVAVVACLTLWVLNLFAE